MAGSGDAGSGSAPVEPPPAQFDPVGTFTTSSDGSIIPQATTP